MVRQFFISIVLTFYLVTGAGGQENARELDKTIIVTASKSPSVYSELTKTIEIITKEKIESLPISSINELLNYALGADIQHRSSHGVQSDISIRGGSFEQTLILIDGVKVNDPQTGHHNLNIPIAIDEIEKIEIVSGATSKLYGPNAMTGVINIITKQSDKTGVHISSSAGNYDLREYNLSIYKQSGNLNQNFFYGRRISDGYHENTEFDIKNYGLNSIFNFKNNKLYYSLRHSDKEFGAYKFYSDNFPNQYETIKTDFMALSAEINLNDFIISPKAYWRQNEDDFILDNTRPDWYRNRHTTDIYGTEIQLNISSSLGTTVIGAELSNEKIESSNLNDHSRNKGGFVFEQRFSTDAKITILPGASLFRHSGWGWFFNPGLDLGYQINESFRWFSSAGKAYRIPTYTDLYYTSAANMGNPELLPEEIWSYETGVRFRNSFMMATISGFYRDGDNLIDWVRPIDSVTWQVQNVSSVTTKGIESRITIAPHIENDIIKINDIRLSYSYLNSDRETGGFESKYLLNYLKHQFIFDLNLGWLNSISQTWRVRYNDRVQDDNYYVVDTRLTKKFQHFSIYAEATNLFNKTYFVIGEIPTPGRWYKAGIQLNVPE